MSKSQHNFLNFLRKTTKRRRQQSARDSTSFKRRKSLISIYGAKRLDQFVGEYVVRNFERFEAGKYGV